MPSRERESGSDDDQNFTFTSPVATVENGATYSRWRLQVIGNHGHFGKTHNPRFFGAWEGEVYGSYGKTDKRERNDDDDDDSCKGCFPADRKVDPRDTTSSHGYGQGGRVPSKRSQEIAKHRQEMMELAQNIPGSSYELTLRDIVELSAITKPIQEISRKEGKEGNKHERTEKGKKLVFRSPRIGTGLLFMKVFVASFLCGRKRGISETAGSNDLAGPVVCDGRCELEIKTGMKLWKKSEYGQMSKSSSTSNSRSKEMSSCYSFLSANKGKDVST